MKDGSKEKYEQFERALQVSADQMYESSMSIAQKLRSEYSALKLDQSAGLTPDMAAVVTFLANPDVIDGSWKFFEFKPIIVTEETSFTSAGGISVKTVILGFMVGFILACVLVMFRIAIRRKDVKAG